MILTQTKALFLDAYRELNARKLFWITIALSAIVVTAFAFITINEEGVKLFGMQTRPPFLNTNYISQAELYQALFVGVAIPYWLAWPAVILALISTAGMIPDFVSGGSIDGFLSKPIGRTRLFLTKVATSLLFVALQVALFAFGWFLLVGIRTGEWSPKVFLAIPIVLAMYSYLYSVCVLIGLVTRSTITALLVTLLFWLALWAGNWSDIYFLGQREGKALVVEDLTQNLERARERQADQQVDELSADLEEAQSEYRSAKRLFTAVTVVRTIVPKTSETTNLLERYLIDIEKEEELQAAQRQSPNQGEEIPPWLMMADPRVAERIGEHRQERSVLWVLGSSLAFEGVILGFAALIFSRRDF